MTLWLVVSRNWLVFRRKEFSFPARRERRAYPSAVCRVAGRSDFKLRHFAQPESQRQPAQQHRQEREPGPTAQQPTEGRLALPRPGPGRTDGQQGHQGANVKKTQDKTE